MDTLNHFINRRILVIDDNRAIHEDFRKILAPEPELSTSLDATEAALFGDAGGGTPRMPFEVESAYQGLDGVALVQKAVTAGLPFAMAFVDVRMPPGIDGLETTRRLWAIDPAIQIVICTAYSDYSWDEMFDRVGHADQLVILKKPFDAVEALQLAHAMTEKWNLQARTERLLADLERQVEVRTGELRNSNRNLQAEVQKHRDSMIASQNLMSDAVRAYDNLRREVEQRKELEDQVREQASLLDKARDAIIVRGMDDRVSYWNRGAERLYGWTASEAIGRTARELVYVDDDDTGEHRLAVSAVMSSDEWSGRIAQRRKDGAPITVEVHATLVRDAQGAPRSVLSICTDITQRAAIEEQLQQSQRLESIGQLTGGVAHDFNNLLTVILGSAEMLAEQLEAQPRLRALAEMTRSAAQRGADLTHRLLAFARRQTLEPRAIDAAALLTGMQDLLRRTLSESIAFDFAVAPGVHQALADPSQLENAILNLCINARDAMPGGGRIRIAAQSATLDAAFEREHPGAVAGAYVRISVADTGQGIPAENLKRVFEPFFTTKAFGKGTGLGLSMVYGFVKQSHGYITITSEVGHGTCIDLYLPVAEVAAMAPAAESPATAATRGAERVLLVEDEDMLRAFAEGQLRALGYDVIATANGNAALDVIRADSGIDLLFTDVVMPGGMNGADLVRAAHALRPELKVLYTSGYTDNAELTLSNGHGPLQFLAKPYRPAELARKLRAALEAEGNPQ